MFFTDHFRRMCLIEKSLEKLVGVTAIDDSYLSTLQTVVGSGIYCIEAFDSDSKKEIRTLEVNKGGLWELQLKGDKEGDPERILVSGG